MNADIPWNEGIEPAPPFDVRVAERVWAEGVAEPLTDFNEVETSCLNDGANGRPVSWELAVPRLNRSTELAMLIDGQFVTIRERGRSCEELEANLVPFTVAWVENVESIEDAPHTPLRPQYVFDPVGENQVPTWVVRTPPLGDRILVLQLSDEDGLSHTVLIQQGGDDDG